MNKLNKYPASGSAEADTSKSRKGHESLSNFVSFARYLLSQKGRHTLLN